MANPLVLKLILTVRKILSLRQNCSKQYFMKLLYFSIILLFALSSCSAPTQISKKDEILLSSYPKDMTSVLEKHGGINNWNAFNTLTYEFEKKGIIEKQIIDLKSRRIRIEQEKFNIGFDGNEAWVEQLDTNTYKGNARFYHNLYFYFYSMPFVLADNGIKYSKTEALSIDSIEYPGIKISYNQSVGDSPEDNYVLYYDKKTKQAEWLGYTVTYFNGMPTDKLHYLKFESWQNVNGLLLPKTLAWYNLDIENNTKKVKSKMTFKNVKLSSKKVSDTIFTKP